MFDWKENYVWLGFFILYHLSIGARFNFFSRLARICSILQIELIAHCKYNAIYWTQGEPCNCACKVSIHMKRDGHSRFHHDFLDFLSIGAETLVKKTMPIILTLSNDFPLPTYIALLLITIKLRKYDFCCIQLQLHFLFRSLKTRIINHSSCVK